MSIKPHLPFAPFDRLVRYNVDGFKQRVAERWEELSNTVLSPENVESHITQIARRYIESGAWQREYNRWKNASDSRVVIGENLNEEVEYVMQWYRGNHSSLTNQFMQWHAGHGDDPDAVTTVIVSQIYEYLLGTGTCDIDKLDLNGDGNITAGDITAAYDIILQN
jgi:hypothetical protein